MFVCQWRHWIILHRCCKGIGHRRMHVNQHVDWQKGWDIKKGLINHSCHECVTKDVQFVNFIFPKILLDGLDYFYANVIEFWWFAFSIITLGTFQYLGYKMIDML
jgi:hypothetical protein